MCYSGKAHHSFSSPKSVVTHNAQLHNAQECRVGRSRSVNYPATLNIRSGVAPPRPAHENLKFFDSLSHATQQNTFKCCRL